MIDQNMPRFVLYADFDAFFVSVERACNPSLRGRPLAVGGMPESCGIVIAASQEARDFGVYPSMSVSSARKLCNDLVVVQGNDSLYRKASCSVIDHFRRFSPRYETVSVDAAYLDLTGVQKLFGPAVDVGARLRREITDKYNLDLAIGVASNKLVSKVASQVVMPGGLCDVRQGDETGFLAPLPIGKLPGVGWSIEKRLWELNIETIRELAGTDRVLLDRLFGRRGKVLHAHAHGLDDSPVGRTRKPKTVGYEETLDRDCNDRNVLRMILFGCVEVAASQLRVLEMTTRDLAVRVQFIDGISTNRKTKLAYHTDIDREIYASSEELLDLCLTRRTSVRQIGVRCSRLTPFSPQLRLFDDQRGCDRSRSLMSAIDCIRRNHGEHSLSWGHISSKQHSRETQKRQAA